MKKYRVSFKIDITEILTMIRQREQGDTNPWPITDFETYEEASMYAFNATLATGKPSTIREIDPDQYVSVRDKVRHILGVEDE